MSNRVTIIGAGPGGYVAALRAAQRGAAVTLVEETEVGGTCLNRGCIPTKTIIASAETLLRCREAASFGVTGTGDAGFDLGAVRERKDKIIATQIKGVRSLLKSWGIAVREGRGSLISPRSVRIAGRDGATDTIESDRIIIATGSRPALLPGFPFDGRTVITSDDAVRLDTIPRSLLIVGAGVIGCEFAFIYRAFGAEVTIVELMPRALSTEDEEISSVIEREMKKHKIKFIPKVKVERVDKTAGGSLTAGLSDGREIETDQILVSIGRSMNTDQIGLETAGVAIGRRGEIIVNERMETNIPGVYAIGDVTGKILLAHVASRQGLVAADNATGGNAVMDYRVVPSGIFTMPEIGSVGLRENEAVQQGIAYRAGKFQFRGLGKAHAMGEITGMVKILSDANTDRILGMHICGSHATDLIHEGVVAMQAGLSAGQLAGSIHAHPTLAEAVLEAAEDVHGLSIHTPKKER